MIGPVWVVRVAQAEKFQVLAPVPQQLFVVVTWAGAFTLEGHIKAF